jgi:ABC-2 type transport system permease protein
MAVRDLGYRPYEGERLPASRNTGVIFRHALRRAWRSWLVKIALFAGILPSIVSVAVILATHYFTQGMGDAGAPPGYDIDAGGRVRDIFGYQLWLFVTLITLGAGSGAIAEDLTHRAFQFYFAKPVTVVQYVGARMGAVAFWSFWVCFVPALLVVAAVAGIAPPEARLERAGLAVPALVFSMVIAVVTATVSVAVSSLSRSRALTMSAWILLFLIPEAVGFVVAKVADWPWLQLTSLPTLLSLLGDGLFRISPDGDLDWAHATPVVLLLVAGSVWLAHARLRKAEVIT